MNSAGHPAVSQQHSSHIGLGPFEFFNLVLKPTQPYSRIL